MKKWVLFSCLITLTILFTGYLCYTNLLTSCSVCRIFQTIDCKAKHSKKSIETRSAILEKIRTKAHEAKLYAVKHNMNTHVGFLINMSQPSGQKRFYILNLKNNRIMDIGLVAHGSGNQMFAATPAFGNVNGSGLSSLGKYKVGKKYQGRFGSAYKLFGLEPSNSNAYYRSIVLHSFSCVPNEETYPIPICNSLGCPMVNKTFLYKLSAILDGEKTPILLWVFV